MDDVEEEQVDDEHVVDNVEADLPAANAMPCPGKDEHGDGHILSARLGFIAPS